MTVSDLPAVLAARWPEIERDLLEGRYQPHMCHQPARRSPFRSNLSSIPPTSCRRAHFLGSSLEAMPIGDGSAALRCRPRMRIIQHVLRH
jgi:hypothetical protein